MRPRRSLGVLCAVVAVAVLAGCGGSEEARPDLLFVSTRDGDYAIFEMNADGSAQHRLTPSDGDATSPAKLFFQIDPAWSPDATRIAFASRRSGTFDIYVMNADGSGTRALASGRPNDTHPTWSADGERIAFQRNSDIWVMNANGSEAEAISDVTAEEGEPAWSPDGAWIAYVRRTPGTASRELWVMRPDGSERRALTAQSATVTTPAWSPDSTRIVFASNRDDDIYALFTIGLDGKGRRSVAPTAADSFEPSWSPDGETIAFFEDGAIYAVTLGSGEPERITDPGDNDSSPEWNPVLAGE